MTPISEAIETVIKHIDKCESEELRKELDLVLVKLIALLGKEKEFLFPSHDQEVHLFVLLS